MTTIPRTKSSAVIYEGYSAWCYLEGVDRLFRAKHYRKPKVIIKTKCCWLAGPIVGDCE